MSQPEVLASYKSPCRERGHLVKAGVQARNRGRYILCIRCNMPQETTEWVTDLFAGRTEEQPIWYPEQYLVKEWP